MEKAIKLLTNVSDGKVCVGVVGSGYCGLFIDNMHGGR